MIHYVDKNIKGVTMKKSLLAALVIAAFVFTGCSQKNPEMDMSNNDTTQVEVADSKASDITGMDKNNMDAQDMSKPTVDIATLISMAESKINTIYFDFDKFDIRADMQAKIDMNAAILKADDTKTLSIKVEGNADEWGTDEYNYALALKRAKSVKDALVANGVDADRIMLVSFGESNPACKESNKACWDQNRRVEFKLLP